MPRLDPLLARRTIFFGIWALAASIAARAEEISSDEPGQYDLQSLIECRSEPSAYGRLAAWLTDDNLPHPGFSEVESGNPFLSQYRLGSPIRIFGRPTQTILFSSSGILAVLDEPSPQLLGQELGVEDAFGRPGKFLGERLVASSSEEDAELGLVFTQTVKLNISEVDSHPGKTLVGCTYQVDFVDGVEAAE